MAAEIPQPLVDVWEKFRSQPAVMQGLEAVGALAVALELDKTLQPRIEQLLHQTHMAWADAVSKNGGQPLTLSQIGDVIKSGLTGKGSYMTPERRVAPVGSGEPMPPLPPTGHLDTPTPDAANAMVSSPTTLRPTGPLHNTHGQDVSAVDRLSSNTLSRDVPQISVLTPTAAQEEQVSQPQLPWWRRTYSVRDHISGVRQLNDSVTSWHNEHVVQPIAATFTAVRDWHTRRSPVTPNGRINRVVAWMGNRSPVNLDGRINRAVAFVMSPYQPDNTEFILARSRRSQQSTQSALQQPAAKPITIIPPSPQR